MHSLNQTIPYQTVTVIDGAKANNESHHQPQLFFAWHASTRRHSSVTYDL